MGREARQSIWSVLLVTAQRLAAGPRAASRFPTVALNCDYLDWAWGSPRVGGTWTSSRSGKHSGGRLLPFPRLPTSFSRRGERMAKTTPTK